MQSIEKKVFIVAVAARSKAGKLAKDKRGVSGIVEVIGLIIVVVVILTVLFFPQIKSWFASVMSSLGTSTTGLFNLT